MSKELSLETRASSAFVLGELEELIRAHRTCIAQDDCALQVELEEVLRNWKRALAELAEAQQKQVECEHGRIGLLCLQCATDRRLS